MRPIHGLLVVLAIVSALVAALLLIGRQPIGSDVASALPAESLAPAEAPRPAADLVPVEDAGSATDRAAAPLTSTIMVGPGPSARPASAGTGFRLRGRVVSAGGAPLAGAKVYAAPSGGFLELPLDELDPERMPFVRRVAGETGADGRFELELDARASLRFAARAAGSAPHDAVVAISGTSHDLGDVALEPGVVIEGRVVDSRGRAVEGAEVRRLGAEDAAFVPMGRAFGAGGALLGTTDAQGLFRVDQLAAGPWRLLFAHDAHPDRIESGETERAGSVVSNLVIELEDGDEIHGRVVGAPDGALANLVVRAQPGGGEGPGGERVVVGRGFAGSGAPATGPRLARVAPDGGFVLRGCKPGASYRLVGREGERAFAARSRTAAAQARAGDRGVQLLYQPATALVFQAVDAESGQPIEALEVQAGYRFKMPLFDDAGRPMRRFPEGRVRFENLPGRPEGGGPGGAAPASLELLVESVGYRAYERTGIAVIEGQDTDLGVIRLERAPLVEVTVLDGATGAPVAGARVTLEEDREPDLRAMRFEMRMGHGEEDDAAVIGGGASQRARTDAAGRAKVTSLPGQRARVRVRAKGFAPYLGEVLTLPVAEDVATTARLVTGAAVVVEVVDTLGAPVAGAVVEHEAPGAGPMPTPGEAETRTDAEGRAAFENLEPGLHRFRLAAAGAPPGGMRVMRTMRGGPGGASIDDGGRPWSEVTLADGARETLRLVAPARGRLSGRVEEGGKPLANATVTLSEPSEGPPSPFGGSGFEAKTNAKGRYAIDDVEVGEKTVRVTHPSRAMAWEGEVELREGDNDLDLDLPVASIEGRVVGADGKPLAGARVRAERAGEGGGRGPRAVTRFLMISADGEGEDSASLSTGVAGSESVLTDAEGRYVLHGVLADVDLVVKASGKDLQPGESKVVRVGADETRRGVDLALEDGGAIEVTVLRADGRPGSNCLVTARYGGEGTVEPKTVLTNNAGTARLPGLRPGTWSVEVRAIGFGAQDAAAPPAQEVEVVVGKSAPARFDVP